MHEATFQDSTSRAFDQTGERQGTHALTPLTRALLICGLIAGPFYIIVGLIQALTRPGFDILRHDLSLLANGDRGIQIEELRIDLEGHIDLPVFLGLREGHAGYPDIAVRVSLKADAPQQAVEELHQHVLKTSPVGHTLEKAIPLHVTLSHA